MILTGANIIVKDIFSRFMGKFKIRVIKKPSLGETIW